MAHDEQGQRMQVLFNEEWAVFMAWKKRILHFLPTFFSGLMHVSSVCLFMLLELCEHMLCRYTHTHFLVSCAGYYPVCFLQDLYNLPISYSNSTCQDVAGRKRFLALILDPRGTERWHPWANVSVMSWVLQVWHWAQHNEWIIVYVMIGVGEKEGLRFT